MAYGQNRHRCFGAMQSRGGKNSGDGKPQTISY
jgi:hypothetical protein